MNKNIKRTLWICIIAFIFAVSILLFLAIANVISFTLAIGLIIIFIIISIIIIFSIYFIVERKKSKEIDINVDTKEEVRINEKTALQIIRERLAESDYMEYLDEIDMDWTPNLGVNKTPIYIVKGKGKFSKKIIVGMINLVTLRKAFKFYTEINTSKEQIEKEIVEIGNLLSSEPTVRKFKTVHEEMPVMGISRTETTPIEEKEKAEENEGEVE